MQMRKPLLLRVSLVALAAVLLGCPKSTPSDGPSDTSAGFPGRTPASAGGEVQAARDRLRLRFGTQSAEVEERMLRRFLALSTALPLVDDTIVTIPALKDPRADWGSWMPPVVGEPPDDLNEIRAILQTPAALPGGNVVTQAFHPEVSARTAMAACIEGQRMILYDPIYILRLTPRSLLFIKNHELGHWAKQHIVCVPTTTFATGELEREADCWAVDQLRAIIPNGVFAIVGASDYFRAQGYPAQPPYPSSTSRSTYLANGCGKPLSLGGPPS